MQFPFHLVIDYIHTKPSEIDRALTEFFGAPPTKPYEHESIMELFAEWLIFEYRQVNGSTSLVEYTLKNSDVLPQETLHQFEQIIHTQFYSCFQILHVNKGISLEVEDIFSGKHYTVNDHLGSQNTQAQGTLQARVVSIDNTYYFVGANPLFFPMTYTPRMRKMMQKESGTFRISIKDSVRMLIDQEANPPQTPASITKQALEQKRKELQVEYEQKARTYHSLLSFSAYLDALYLENKKRPLDFWKGLEKQGLPNEFLVEEMQLHQDIWNHFPHKILNNLSPAELYSKLSKQKKK